MEGGDPPPSRHYLDVIVSDVRMDWDFRCRCLVQKVCPLPDRVPTLAPDGQWYRAKVKKSSVVRRGAQLTFIGYGNQDTIGFKDFRPLEQLPPAVVARKIPRLKPAAQYSVSCPLAHNAQSRGLSGICSCRGFAPPPCGGNTSIGGHPLMSFRNGLGLHTWVLNGEPPSSQFRVLCSD